MSTSVGLVEAMTTTIISQGTRKACAAFYFLFARLFREPPSEELLRLIVDDRLLTIAERWGDSQRHCRADALLDLAEDPAWPAHAEEIAVEYARLFAVPGDQAVRPYESVYCDTLAIDTTTACSPYFDPEPIVGGLTGFLHGPSANAVRDAYQHAGFSVEPGCHELPDHLAIELEFMGRLLERGEVDQANTFFTNHLGRWAFRCLNDIKQEASAGFYRAAADALAVFLHREREVLALDATGSTATPP
jgi:TorA maturation chaperone TorD